MFITKYRDSKGRNRKASPVILARESGSLGDDSPGEVGTTIGILDSVQGGPTGHLDRRGVGCERRRRAKDSFKVSELTT